MFSALNVGANGIITITGKLNQSTTGGAFAIVLTPTYATGAVLGLLQRTGATQYAPSLVGNSLD